MTAAAVVWVSGAATALLALATTLWSPGLGEIVFYNASSGANEVRVPAGFWLAVAAWGGVTARVSRLPPSHIAPRVIVIALVTHALAALAAFAPLLDDLSEFTSPGYRLYAGLFCATALAAAAAWSALTLRDPQSPSGAMSVPIAVAAGALAWMLMAVHPIAGGAATALGWVAGTRLRRPAARERLRELLTRARAVVASDTGFMIALFIGALALRLLYLQRVLSNPGYLETGADGPVYDELAWSMAQGLGFRETFTERFPMLLLGYVWFVSGIYAVVGHSYFAVGAIQAVIGSTACVLFYSVSRELFNRAIARVAALFAAISFPLLFAAAAIGHQAIDVFLTMVIVWALVRSGPPAGWPWWRWCVIGVLFGAAIAVRETVTFFLAFVLLWIPFLFDRPWSVRAIGAAALVLVTAGATLAPLAIPKVASAEQRAKLKHHFDILYRGEADPLRIRDEIVGPLSNPSGALSQLRESPALVVGTLGRAWARNFALQFFAQPYGGFDLVLLRKGTAYYYTISFYAAALAAAGLWMLVRRLPADAHAAGIVLILGLITSRTIPHLILESNYRHRAPIEPFLILLASVAVVQLVTSARRAEPVH